MRNRIAEGTLGVARTGCGRAHMYGTECRSGDRGMRDMQAAMGQKDSMGHVAEEGRSSTPRAGPLV